MIAPQCQAHNGRYCELTRFDDRALLTRTDGENSALGWIDNRVELLDAKHTQVGDTKAATLEFLGLESAELRSGG